jgi:hypothetical protein
MRAEEEEGGHVPTGAIEDFKGVGGAAVGAGDLVGDGQHLVQGDARRRLVAPEAVEEGKLRVDSCMFFYSVGWD